MDAPPLHPAVRPLGMLLGTWRGAGRGDYPTIESFAYDEEISFAHSGRPFLTYSQRTTNPRTNEPMHTETGYWRPRGDDHLEVVIAHPTGLCEVLEGTNTAGQIVLTSRAVALTSTAKQVTRIDRSFRVDGDLMTYTVRMAAVGQELGVHLTGELRRI